MRVVLSPYESRGDLEPMVGSRVGVADLQRGGAVCASPDCAELLGNLGVPLMPIGVWQ
jgi:hypothetical protein